MEELSPLDRLRGYGSLKPLNSENLSGKWLLQYARGMLFQPDSFGFLLGGLVGGLVSEYFRQVEANGEVILLALAAVGFAALAVALTALTIFVSFVNDTYLRILAMDEDRGGLSGYIVPYLAAALVSTTTTTFGVVGAIVYGAIHDGWAKAIILGLEAGFVVWAAWGVFQLVIEISVHGLNRYELEIAVDKTPDVSVISARNDNNSIAGESTAPPDAPGDGQ